MNASPWSDIVPLLEDELGFTGTARAAVGTWSLVLSACSIPHRPTPPGPGGRWRLLVPEERAGAAVTEILLFEEENRDEIRPAASPPEIHHNTATTLFVLLLFTLFHGVAHGKFRLFGLLDPQGVDWAGLGSADSLAIKHGEWWRLATSLTLHGGGEHLLANMLIGGVVFFLLCRQLGSGVGWFLALAAGILGNAMNYGFREITHNSLGLSTAVFGAIGILAGRHAFRAPPGKGVGRPHFKEAFLTVGAGLALLGFLGSSGENTDLGAHLFGFFAGLGLGVGLAVYVGLFGTVGRTMQALLGLAAFGALAGAWALALA